MPLPDAGAPMNTTDWAAPLDDHEDRLDALTASVATLASQTRSYLDSVSVCSQKGAYVGTVDGDGRVTSIPFLTEMPELPIVNVSLGDYTGVFVIGVIPASVTTEQFDAFVFLPDDSPATGSSVRINWDAQCPFPSTGTITG